MSKIVDFNLKKAERDPTIITLVQFSDEIDSILTKYLSNPAINAVELAGVLAHRFGCFLSLLDNKDEVWSIYETIIKRQANLK